MNGGTYALGPGNHANATISRALRLFIYNLGGGKVGVNLMGNEPILNGREMYGQKYLWRKEYLNMPDDAVIRLYPRKYIFVVVVGNEVNNMMQAWRMACLSTASIDKWR
jgi:hypothetical protein